jgi:phosphoglucomutase
LDRPSFGTENIYEIYAESFQDEAHPDAIVVEARQLADRARGARQEHQEREGMQ